MNIQVYSAAHERLGHQQMAHQTDNGATLGTVFHPRPLADSITICSQNQYPKLRENTTCTVLPLPCTQETHATWMYFSI